MKEFFKEFGYVGAKVLLFLAGFCACLSMLTGAAVVLTAMNLLDSILVSIVPSLLFGWWCQHLNKRDYEGD